MDWFNNIIKKINDGVQVIANLGKKISASLKTAQNTIDALQGKVTEVEDKIKNTVSGYEEKLNTAAVEAATVVQKVQGEIQTLGTIGYEAVNNTKFKEVIKGATTTKVGLSLDGKEVLFVYYKGPVQLGQTVLSDGKRINFKATYDISILS